MIVLHNVCFDRATVVAKIQQYIYMTYVIRQICLPVKSHISAVCSIGKILFHSDSIARFVYDYDV